jgi:translation elongation factor EF-Tu-like GTPase
MIPIGDDFIATVRYKNTQEGGRKDPVSTGYWPQLKFHFTEKQSGGRQTFIDKKLVHPGESAKASIKILSPHFFEHSLKEGLEFEIREGNTVVGTGVIESILNPNLLID